MSLSINKILTQPDFQFRIPALDTAYEFLEYYARNTPEIDAIIFQNQRVSYRNLKENVDSLARSLMAVGIKPGDRVATLSAPHPDCSRILLASLSIGAIWVGLNPRYQLSEMLHVITDSQPSILFSCSRIDKRVFDLEIKELQESPVDFETVTVGDQQLLPNSVSIGEFRRGGITISDEDLQRRRRLITGDDACMIVYTSGTTGAPKGALLKQSASVRQGKLTLSKFKPNPLRVINYYPVNHVAGVVANTLYTLVGGGTNVLIEKFSPAETLATIERERITQWGAIPTMFKLCINDPGFLTSDLSSVQLINWGGSAASRDMIELFAGRFPYLSTLMAMTETTGGITQITPCKDIDLLSSSVGQPMPDCELRLTDELGSEVANGNVGEIQVRGPFLMLEYWNNPVATADTFTEDGWLKTGDLAKQDSQGNLYVVGRNKEMYKSGGFNIYPREVEQALESIESIDLVAVVSVPDPLYDEVGHAFISLKTNAVDISENTIRAHAGRNLANYKVPKVFHIVDELPLLPNGKINKKLLAQRAKNSLGELSVSDSLPTIK